MVVGIRLSQVSTSVPMTLVLMLLKVLKSYRYSMYPDYFEVGVASRDEYRC